MGRTAFRLWWNNGMKTNEFDEVTLTYPATYTIPQYHTTYHTTIPYHIPYHNTIPHTIPQYHTTIPYHIQYYIPYRVPYHMPYHYYTTYHTAYHTTCHTIYYTIYHTTTTYYHIPYHIQYHIWIISQFWNLIVLLTLHFGFNALQILWHFAGKHAFSQEGQPCSFKHFFEHRTSQWGFSQIILHSGGGSCDGGVCMTYGKEHTVYGMSLCDIRSAHSYIITIISQSKANTYTTYHTIPYHTFSHTIWQVGCLQEGMQSAGQEGSTQDHLHSGKHFAYTPLNYCVLWYRQLEISTRNILNTLKEKKVLDASSDTKKHVTSTGIFSHPKVMWQ